MLNTPFAVNVYTPSLLTFIPVSYTHLDVYKRQELTEQVEQTKTTMEAAIEDATRLITGQDGGYIVLDPAERPERILIMDQPEKTRAQNVWCWNLAGLGYSYKGINGPYELAMTMDGKIVADCITTGKLSGITIQGNTIIAGGQNNTSGEIKALSGDGNIEYAKLDHTGLTAIGGKDVYKRQLLQL